MQCQVYQFTQSARQQGNATHNVDDEPTEFKGIAFVASAFCFVFFDESTGSLFFSLSASLLISSKVFPARN